MEKVIYCELWKRLNFAHTDQWYMNRPESFFENEKKFSRIFRWPDLMLVNRKKRASQLGDFVVLADYKLKIKENEKLDKYQNLARALKKLWNMKLTVIPIKAEALRIIQQNLEKRFEELESRRKIKFVQTSALTRILRKVQRKWKDLQLLGVQWIPLASTDVKYMYNSTNIKFQNNTVFFHNLYH